ncbi:uncharacterized protein LOC111259930 [Varroa jacobsoni]|uniref:uncharacterized protein LOC111259930 n=1 Tax=Varroa jacobsoni TaxID=62625 RepID=UPI000BF5AA1D|nr:uncharacterized protein LOC111259930 [Varroa jacobsoni]
MSGKSKRRAPARHNGGRRDQAASQETGTAASIFPSTVPSAEKPLPSQNSNITPKVDIRMMKPISESILQYRILQHGHKTVKRARHKKATEVTFRGDPDYSQQGEQTRVVVDIRANAPADSLTFPRACALAAVSTLKAPTADRQFPRKSEIASIIKFGEFSLARRCCINGARYLGRFIAQEVSKDHPAYIPAVGIHPTYGFEDGDLGEWLAAMVAMDYAKMRNCNELQHVEAKFSEESSICLDQLSQHPLYDFYLSEDVEPKFRKITLDAVTYMGWSDGRQPITWSELIDRDCKNSIKLSEKDRNRLENVLKQITLAS